jgi:hypothetical protein
MASNPPEESITLGEPETPEAKFTAEEIAQAVFGATQIGMDAIAKAQVFAASGKKAADWGALLGLTPDGLAQQALNVAKKLKEDRALTVEDVELAIGIDAQGLISHVTGFAQRVITDVKD